MLGLVPAGNRLYFVAFVDRGDMRRIISLRYAERREGQALCRNYPKRTILMPSVDENAEHRCFHAKADPDARPLTKKQLKQWCRSGPFGVGRHSNPRRRWFPFRYSPEVIEYFTQHGRRLAVAHGRGSPEYVSKHVTRRVKALNPSLNRTRHGAAPWPRGAASHHSPRPTGAMPRRAG